MTAEASRHAMRRRAMLSPVFIAGALAFVLLVVVVWVAAGIWQSPGVVVVVRHVEKSVEPATNPGPSDLGERRARELAQMFASSGIDAVYATEYLRSFATATPLATRLSKPLHVYEAGDAGALVAAVDASHRYGRVFIIGHSNTVPDIVRAFSGQRIAAIDESRYGDIFIIVRPRWGRTELIQLYQPAPSP